MGIYFALLLYNNGIASEIIFLMPVRFLDFKIKKLLAGAKGFEPLNDGAKTRCLTTWPRPNYIENTINAG